MNEYRWNHNLSYIMNLNGPIRNICLRIWHIQNTYFLSGRIKIQHALQNIIIWNIFPHYKYFQARWAATTILTPAASVRRTWRRRQQRRPRSRLVRWVGAAKLTILTEEIRYKIFREGFSLIRHSKSESLELFYTEQNSKLSISTNIFWCP